MDAAMQAYTTNCKCNSDEAVVLAQLVEHDAC